MTQSQLKLEEIVIKKTMGKDLFSTMARVVFKDFYEAIKEFYCNSYDADAENVFITYDSSGTGTLTIEDDGEGMDASGLESFFRMGDSEKKHNPISKKGRRKIGKFGIATVLLRDISQEYELHNFHGGKETVFRETFKESGSEEAQVGGEVYACDESKQGLKIIMRNLNFEPENRGGRLVFRN